MNTSAPSEIRLKVAYKNAQALLGEFTRSVGQGSVALESRKPVQPGTRFIFELSAQGVPVPLDVVGEVRAVEPLPAGRFLLHVSYNLAGSRQNLDALLQQVFDAHRFEKSRLHPRIPLHLRASDETPHAATFLVRDLSLGGAGIEAERPTLPRAVQVDAPCLLEIWLTTGTLQLHGEVLWVLKAPENPESQALVRPALGMRFGKLRTTDANLLERTLRLRGLPPPPWRARVSFGLDAVTRMPGSSVR